MSNETLNGVLLGPNVSTTVRVAVPAGVITPVLGALPVAMIAGQMRRVVIVQNDGVGPLQVFEWNAAVAPVDVTLGARIAGCAVAGDGTGGAYITDSRQTIYVTNNGVASFVIVQVQRY